MDKTQKTGFHLFITEFWEILRLVNMSFHLRKESAKHLSEGKSTGAHATKVQVLNHTCHSTREETVQITSEKKDEVWVLKIRLSSSGKMNYGFFFPPSLYTKFQHAE